MRSLIAALLCFVTVCSVARGDGYRFDPETQEVTQDSLRFRLSAEQIASISMTGVVTFSAQQLTVVRRLYPAAAPTQSVIAATFNDNNESEDPDNICCFWVRANELAITILDAVVANPAKARKALSEPADGPPDPVAVRISPEGLLYHRGKSITLPQVFRLIDAVERPKRPIDYFDFRVVVPPPYAPDRAINKSPANDKVREVFKALADYGETHGVPVYKSW